MPKRISDEGRIVLFFTNAPIDVARSLLNIASEIVKSREPKRTRKAMVHERGRRKAESSVPTTGYPATLVPPPTDEVES